MYRICQTDHRVTRLKMFIRLLCVAVIWLIVRKTYGVSTDIPSTKQALETALKMWFPHDAEFNESCVSEGCPALNDFSLCPNDFNITVLHSVLNTAIGCMRKPMCGILIDRRPTPTVSMTTDDWLPEMDLDGVVTIDGTAGYLTNISNTEFEILFDPKQTHRPSLRITMLISNMHAFGYLSLSLTLRTMLPNILGQPVSFTLPRVKYDIVLNYVATISINQSLTDHIYELKLLNPLVNVHPTFCGLDLPEGFPSITTLFTMMAQIIYENSTLTVRKAAFLEKYFQSVIRTVSKHC